MERKIFAMKDKGSLETLQNELEDYSTYEKAFGASAVFIKRKGRVVAKAKWNEHGNLIITKIRRPASTELKVDDVIYESNENTKIEIPPKPEIEHRGHILVRNRGYESKQAIRKDPFWEKYQGWFIIPEKLFGENGEDSLLEDYTEMQNEAGDGIEILQLNEVNEKQLKMVRFAEVNEYVCGFTDKIPELHNFVAPKIEDMFDYKSVLCHCGCGSFEHWNKVWVNKWIVYVER